MATRFSVVALLIAVTLSATANAAPSDAPFDCAGPAGDPASGTAAWHAREQANDWCGEERAYDTSTNPLFGAGSALTFFGTAGQRLEDPYRDPASWNGNRGRYTQISFKTSTGERLQG